MGTAPVTLTSPDKVLWPETGWRKADLWAYFEAVAERLLRHISGRPLTLLRHPNGVGQPGFLQKNLPASAPEWLGHYATWTPSSRRTVTYLLADDLAALQWMANQAAVELHAWFSRAGAPDTPDLLALDLDPGAPGQSVHAAALQCRQVLDELGLQALVKTSGKRGLHLYVPVQRRYSYDELRAFGLALARACADRDPGNLTVEMRKAPREGRLLIDWSRAGQAQTLVAAWSPRAQPGGTVSTPLSWEEVEGGIDPTTLTLKTAPDRPDHWADPPAGQRIERARADLAAAGFPSLVVSPRGRTTAEALKRAEDADRQQRSFNRKGST